MTVRVVLVLCIASCSRAAVLGNEENGSFARGHTSPVVFVAVDDEGRFVASVSNDGMLIVWDATSGRALWARHSRVRSIALPSGKDQIDAIEWTMSDDDRARLRVSCYSRESGERLPSPSVDVEEAEVVAISPDGRQLVAAYETSAGYGPVRVRMWDLPIGALRWSGEGHRGRPTAISLGPDGRSAAVGCCDGMCMVFDTQKKRSPEYYSGHTKPVGAVAMSSEGEWFAASSDSGTILWDASDHTVYRESRDSGCRRGVASFAPQGKSWLGSVGDGGINFYDEPGMSPEHLGRRFVCPAGFSYARILGSGERILTGSYGGGVALWDVATGEVVRHFGTDVGVPTDIAFSPDRSRLVVGYSGNLAMVWDIPRRRVEAVLEDALDDSNGFVSVAWSRDGRMLATGHGTGETQRGIFRSVHLWDARSLDKVASLPLTLGHADKGTNLFLGN